MYHAYFIMLIDLCQVACVYVRVCVLPAAGNDLLNDTLYQQQCGKQVPQQWGDFNGAHCHCSVPSQHCPPTHFCMLPLLRAASRPQLCHAEPVVIS